MRQLLRARQDEANELNGCWISVVCRSWILPNLGDVTEGDNLQSCRASKEEEGQPIAKEDWEEEKSNNNKEIQWLEGILQIMQR